MWLFLILLYIYRINSIDVCSERPADCQLLCPFGYIKDALLQQCQCTCAIDPCQTTICGPTESCIAVGIKARCIPRFGSNREECPRLTGGICALRCEKDSDCSGRLICCSNGCGRECVAPIRSSFPIKAQTNIQPIIKSGLPNSFQNLINVVSNIAKSTPIPPTMRNIAANIIAQVKSSPIRPETTKVGQCPTNQKTNCSLRKKCSNDMDCSSFDKCCATDCGFVCQEPVKATACIHMNLAISQLPDKRLANEFVPYCERNGRFSSIQCNTISCWCVDVHYGSELPGTRVDRVQRRPQMCQDHRLCSNKCYNSCPHGHELDIFGCPLLNCPCLDICANIKCSNPTHSCQLIEPDCANPPCLPVPRCLLNPCRHGNPLQLSNGITALCSSDSDCNNSSCFKIGYNGLGFCCKSTESLSIKDGRCPSQSADKSKCAQSLSNECYSDNECPNDKKCCFNGCSLSCLAPETYSVKPTVQHYQPGDVEKYNKEHLSSLVADCADNTNVSNSTCSSECHSDEQCSGMKRCCRNGCSTMCMYPVRSTPCFHLSLTAELYSLRTAQRCDRAGNYEQFQCDDEGCYCVDVISGDPIPSTRQLGGLRPNCDAANRCEPIVCRTSCPYGYEVSLDLCPTCKCKNPCEEVKCPQGSVCVMSSVQCYQTANCPKQPRCVINFCPSGNPFISAIGTIESCTSDSECPTTTHWCHSLGLSSGGICCPAPIRHRNSGSCPLIPVSLDAQMCQVMCRVDDDCDSHQKCCFDGCGAKCTDLSTHMIEIPKESFEKPGQCITEQRVLCNRLERNTCDYDSDCAGVAKCCDDGCIKSCAFPLQTSKCLIRKTNLQKMGQMDLIKCRPDGSFEPIQCDTEFCWCVDEDGNFVDGTKTGDDVTPKCPEPCPPSICPELKCEYGRKKDSSNCPICECLDPCEEVDCAEDSICVPTSTSCASKPCPTIPKCVINPCATSEAIKNSTTFMIRRCTIDSDCYSSEMTTHCSLLTGSFGFCCTGEQKPTNSGRCPSINKLKTDKCERECRSDADCGETSKCCWNGCGLQCVQSVSTSSARSFQNVEDARFGECLAVPSLGAFCVQRPNISDCSTDSDCPSLFRCCFDGCVNRCSHPHRAPLCIHQRLAAQQIASDLVFVPDCDSNGNFDEIQSHYGLMWCVDKNGREVPGTKSVKTVPNCDTPRSCPEFRCKKKCIEYKTDNQGCRLCDCSSPCDFISCPVGNICRLVKVECSTDVCRPVPKCLPNMCTLGEPLGLPPDSLLATCNKNHPCPAGYSCKNAGYDGFSICCPAPEPPQKSLTCPQVPIMLGSVDGSSCVVGCRQHSDCVSSSCCFNGCGTSCQFETFPIKPSKKINEKPLMTNIQVQTLQAPPKVKLGTCASVIINPGCVDHCRHDADCPEHEKCCQASCGRVCSLPKATTACIHMSISYKSQKRKIYCRADGLFDTKQCHKNRCWCVNPENGVELIGTRGLPTIDCSKFVQKICTKNCGENSCEFGVALDSNGCPISCECYNPCQDYRCSKGFECALRDVECTTPTCTPVPHCVSTRKCKNILRESYGNPITCSVDSPCPTHSQCESGICCSRRTAQAAATVTAPTNCTTLKEALIKAKSIGANIKVALPMCSSLTGEFERTQCFQNRCWCVDSKDGSEIPGTRTLSIVEDACSVRMMCNTRCTTICPFGLQLDDSGCPTTECLCKSACDFLQCPAGQVCIMRQSNCFGSWCLPTPTCERSPCINGMRALVDPITRQQHSCSSEATVTGNCPFGYYCTGFDDNMKGVCCPSNELSKNRSDRFTCPHGDPFSSQPDGTPQECTETHGCPSTHYCSTYPGESIGICCVSKHYVCSLNVDSGPCKAKVKRFYYSSLTASCAAFIYGGCAGNLNNFGSSADCHSFCGDVDISNIPFSDSEKPLPVDKYEIGFKINSDAKLESAEHQIMETLKDKFEIAADSIQDLRIDDENMIRFVIEDSDAAKIAQTISSDVMSGRLSFLIDGTVLSAEPRTLQAHHVGEPAKARVAASAIVLSLIIITILIISVFIISCFCLWTRKKNDNNNDSINTNPSQLNRVFSRGNITPFPDEKPLRRATRQRSWISIG